MKRLAVCCSLIAAVFFTANYFPPVREFGKTVWQFDKYQHMIAGALLMIGFLPGWRKNFWRAFGALLLCNIVWESFEVLGYYIGWFDQVPFDRAWAIDTAGDIATTMTSGMLFYFFLYRKTKKRP